MVQKNPTGLAALARTAATVVFSTVLLYSAAPSASAGAQQRRSYFGRPVAEVLAELQTPQVQIIFSSTLVPPTLRVLAEPAGSTPRQIASEILAPHNLTLRSGPRGRLIVVRAEAAAPAARDQSTRDRPAPDASELRAPPNEPLRIEERVEVVERQHDARARASAYAVDEVLARDTAGALDLFHVFRNVPAAAATNDADGTYAVRGLGPEHNLIVLDGVQIHHPRRLGEYTSSFVSPMTTRSVRIDASGLDADHGGRLSSVTEIETRDGTRDRPLAFSGSLGLTSGDALVEGRLANTESGSWWLTARGTYYGPLVNRLSNDAVAGFGDVQFKISARPTPRTRLAVFGLGGRETAGDRDRASETRDVAGAPSDGTAVVPGAEYTGVNVIGLVNLTWTPHERWATMTTVSAYRHDARDYDASLGLAGVRPFERGVRVGDVAARQTVAFAPWSRHLFEGGAEVHRIASTWRMSEAQAPEFARGLGPSIWGEAVDYPQGAIDTSLARTHVGAWLQHRMPVGPAFDIEPGVRVDWNSLTGEASWQPRLRVTTTAGGAVLWAGISAQAQTPSHETMQGFDYFHLTQAVGPQLRNARSRQIVAGAERRLGAGLHLRVEAYRREFDRLLVQRPETDAERTRRLSGYEIPHDLPADSAILEHRPTMHPESSGRGRASGLELQLLRRGERVTGTFTYALTKSTREMYGYTFPFDFDRRHALYGSAVVAVSRRVRAGVTWQRASGFPITPLQEEIRFVRRILPDGTVDPVARPIRNADGSLARSPLPAMRRLSQRNAGRLNSYARTDLRVTYSTLGRWEFYGEVLNVFGTHNHQEETDSVPGGAISPYSAYNYFQRLPSFGVRVHF